MRAIAVVTVAELGYGARLARWGTERLLCCCWPAECGACPVFQFREQLEQGLRLGRGEVAEPVEHLLLVSGRPVAPVPGRGPADRTKAAGTPAMTAAARDLLADAAARDSAAPASSSTG
jgi:hypothetical protein